jgi:hypothetical protein
MNQAQACAALALVKGENPNAQLYGNDSAPGKSSHFVISLDGTAVGGYFLQTCP